MKKKIFNFMFNILLKMNGDVVMMALLLAQRIILDRLTFEEVPKSLKEPVYQVLKESGLEFLAGDYVPVNP